MKCPKQPPCHCPLRAHPHREDRNCRSLRAHEEFTIVASSEFDAEADYLARQSAVHVNAVNRGRAK